MGMDTESIGAWNRFRGRTREIIESSVISGFDAGIPCALVGFVAGVGLGMLLGLLSGSFGIAP
jgi:ABC-type nitrate/sulfonate/bicarbonate transport system permease component